jgi:adenylyltransferase/sulfurtransferase
VDIKVITRRLSGDELDAAAGPADLVIDGTDNFASRFEQNRACGRHWRTLISGAVILFEGQVTV